MTYPEIVNPCLSDTSGGDQVKEMVDEVMLET